MTARREAIASMALALLACFASIALAGCGSDGASRDAGADFAVRSDLRVVRDLAQPTASVKGTFRDENGRIVPNAPVQVCGAAQCWPGSTDADGNFFFSGLTLEYLVLKAAEDREATPMRAEAVAPLHLTMPDEVLDIGTLFAPTVPKVAPYTAGMKTPQAIDAGDGLTLTLVPADFAPAFGAEKFPFIGARLVPPERRCSTFDTGGEIVQASYALMPFASESSSKLGVRVALKLPPGTEVHLRTVSYLDGRLDPPAIGHEAEDGLSASTDADQGIDHLSWLLVTTKP